MNAPVTIVTDSACDLPRSYLEARGVQVVPLWVNFSGEQYRDGVDLTPGEFMELLSSSKEIPTTSAPTSQQFVETFDRTFELRGTDSEIVVLSLTSKLSRTFEAATQGAASHPLSKQIYVVDTYQVSIAAGVLVALASERADADVAAVDIARELEARKHAVEFRGVVQTLKFLQAGGRIGAAASLLGSALRILPVLRIKNGEMAAAGRARKRSDARAKILDGVSTKLPFRHLAVIADAPEFDLVSHVPSKWADKIIHGEIGALVGTFTGPGAAGIAALGYDEQWDQP